MFFDKVLLIGNGRVADDIIRILVKNKVTFEYIQVIAEEFTFTRKLCEKLSVPFKEIDKNKVGTFLSAINKKTLIISAHNSYIFPSEVCNNDFLTIINMHIAFLPHYRGMNPTTWAIYNQEEYAGVTWHLVTDKIDNGRIIVQRRIKIEEDETAIKLMMRCFREGISLFEENLVSFIDNTFKTFIPENPNSRLYRAKELPNDGYVDEKWGFDKTYAFLRSMDYSGTNLMRLPRIVYDEQTYEIERYKKRIEGVCTNKRESYLDDRNLIVQWGGCFLNCKLRDID